MSAAKIELRVAVG